MSRPWDVVVVGGGIVGVATAREVTRRRPGARVLLIEKQPVLAAHQTGHNSGVIHAGIYYPAGSLKAELCRLGRQATEQYAETHGIPWRRTGKLLVATDAREVAGLDALAQRARDQGIGFEQLTAQQLIERQPALQGLGALFLHDTGITDYRLITESMGREVEDAGGELRLGTEMTAVREGPREVLIETDQGGVSARQAVFCAGIQADRVAAMAGLDVDFAMVPFRGEYYDVVGREGLVDTLVYPVPDPRLPFLGVHLTVMVDGGLTVGPNAVLGLAREGYPKGSVNRRDVLEMARFPGLWRVARAHLRTGAAEVLDSVSTRGYLRRCRRYCPSLQLDDLVPREAGIRAQAVLRDGTFVHDFLLRRTPRTLHVVNAPSPAATSAMPIAERIVDQLSG